MVDNNKLGAVQNIANAAFTLPPNSPSLYNADGTLNWAPLANGRKSWNNPLANLNMKYINNTTNLVSNLVLSYQIIPGMEIKSSFGYNELESEEVQTRPLSAVAPYIRPTTIRTTDFNSAKVNTWIIEPQLTYVKQIGLSKFDFLLGTTIQQEDRDRQRLNASGFTSDESMLNIKAASSVIVDNSSDAVIISRYKYNAIFSRLNYKILDRYIISGSIRRDGSSRFGKENRFHNFASVSGAWIFSNEDFIKNNISFLSFGKIRASYGSTGSDQIGDYVYLNLYGNTQTLGSTYQGIVGLQPSSSFPNPYLQWEETRKFSSTIDFGCVNDRILLTMTYYRNTSTNQLAVVNLPSITGGSSVSQNRPIIVQNKGWEIGLNTIDVKSKYFNWTSSVNLTVPKNKLVKYDDLDAAVKKDLVGKPIGITKVYHFIGVDSNTGLYTFSDINGKSTSNPNPDMDKTIYIDQNPSFYGGFQNTFTYKGFSLEVLFQFVRQKSSSQIFGFYPGGTATNQLTNVLDRWKKAGDISTIQKYNTDFSLFNQWTSATQSDKAYGDASYIRLKNLSFSYQLPMKWINKVHIQELRIYAHAQNLLTFTNFKGADPESRNFYGIPPLKVLTIGLNVTL